MKFRAAREIGNNGAVLVVECQIRTVGVSGPRVPIGDVKREDVEALIEKLKKEIFNKLIDGD